MFCSDLFFLSLEGALSSFTVLTEGESISISFPGLKDKVTYLVRKCKPANTINIFNTVLEVDFIGKEKEKEKESESERKREYSPEANFTIGGEEEEDFGEEAPQEPVKNLRSSPVVCSHLSSTPVVF